MKDIGYRVHENLINRHAVAAKDSDFVPRAESRRERENSYNPDLQPKFQNQQPLQGQNYESQVREREEHDRSISPVRDNSTETYHQNYEPSVITEKREMGDNGRMYDSRVTHKDESKQPLDIYQQ